MKGIGMKKEKSVSGLKAVLAGVILMVATWAGMVSAEQPPTLEEAYPGLATSVLKSARLVEMEKDLVLQSNGMEIRTDFEKEILQQAQPEMRPELEKHIFLLLEQQAMEKLVQQDALSLGIPVDQPKNEMIRAYIDRITGGLTVSGEEARSFYETNKEMFGGMPFEQVKDSIEPFLLEQKRMEALDLYIEDLAAKFDIRLNRDWVKKQADRAMDNPVDRARMSGKPTLVEFGATGCVPCDMMQPILEKIKKKFPERLNIVFAHVGENPMLGARFGIRVIPVQVFFDAKGKEVFRHQGFYPEAEILAQLKKMGVE